MADDDKASGVSLFSGIEGIGDLTKGIGLEGLADLGKGVVPELDLAWLSEIRAHYIKIDCFDWLTDTKKIAVSLEPPEHTIPKIREQAQQLSAPKHTDETLPDTVPGTVVPPSKFIDKNSKYAELLRDADEAYRHLYKRPHTARALFVNIPELCPHLVSEAEGTGEQIKLIIKGDAPLTWRQFRIRHYKNHFPD